ncbi:MAG: hypothetical protein GY801_24275 [bacterium]|nr:hypothetical protein [bacterium]
MHAWTLRSPGKYRVRKNQHWSIINYIKGLAPWILYDFPVSRRYNRFQKGWSRKGLIADDKQTKKPAFYVLQKFYQEKAGEE